MINTAIIPGSLSAVVEAGKPMALAFMDIDYVALVDTSGSMSDKDARGGKSRYDVACEELKTLQGENPGKILVISFSGNARLCLGGIPDYQGGSTDLADALRFVKQYDLPGMTFFVISDGYPDSAQAALNEAAKFEGVINTIFVGPERDSIGREFLARLAEKNGGKTALAEKGDLLAKQFNQLLLKG
jgi:hypothetical protein